MATIYVELRAVFECPKCYLESQADPGTSKGKTVVCRACGTSYRAGAVGYPVFNWNKRNREEAKALALGTMKPEV